MLFDREKEDSLRKVVMKIFDPNIDSPDVFFKMDEIDDVQILRKYDKSSGEVRYAGTYEVLFKTEDLNRLCLIMSRIENEKPVADDLTPLAEELGALIVCEYAPGTHSRIYLKGLSEDAVNRIVDKYEKKQRRRGKRK
ncbi:MAG: hypothetical protein ACSW8G_03750 [Bacillota bacterium]